MNNAPRARKEGPILVTANGPPSESAELVPSLTLAFKNQGCATEHRLIPRAGLMLGLGASVFDEPFDDTRMSVRHAEVGVDSGQPFVRDLSSSGGTRVNGDALMGKRSLVAGDVIRIGDTLFVYAAAAAVTLPEPESELIGESAALVAVRRSIEAVARHMHTVVVTGETGTGKEVVARVLHQRSGRTGPLVAVNCGAFAEGLLPSDLFGHVRGAFTGAVTEEQGLFRAARAGTLLLDEVAEIAIGLQANLLRVMEARQVRPVGSTRDIAIDVRVVATSNRELMALVQERSFRSDLYSRLAQWTIRLPPLRERREDIPSLTRSLLGRCDASGRAMTSDLAEALLLHDWPLNVRGLFNVLAIAAICAPSGVPLSLGAEVRSAMWTSRTLALIPDEKGPLVVDKDALEQLLGRFNGGVAAAARHLGITRPRLYRLLKVRGVEPSAFRHRG